MANWMIDASKLDDQQYDVLEMDIKDSKIVKGCAGSGKTILAVHTAAKIRAKNQGTFLIIVYTKALKAFISDGIRKLNLKDTDVKYEYEWKSDGMPKYDYLIIDESQDFCAEDIALFKSAANKGFIFFGDSVQQLYQHKNSFGKSYTSGPTVSMEKISEMTAKKILSLYNNHRMPQSIAEVAQHITTGSQNIVANCIKKGGNKPQRKSFSSKNAELDWMISKIQNEGLKDVGVLLRDNNDVQFVRDYFNNKGIKFGIKINADGKNIEQLDFNGNIPNLMTYHSSKGLQFENVFMPFCNAQGSNDWETKTKNAFYVAVTRASQNLYITYSDSLNSIISNVPSNLFI